MTMPGKRADRGKATGEESTGREQDTSMTHRVLPWLGSMHIVYESHKRQRKREKQHKLEMIEKGRRI